MTWSTEIFLFCDLIHRNNMLLGYRKPQQPLTSYNFSSLRDRTKYILSVFSSSTLATEPSPSPPCTSLGLSSPIASPLPTTPLSPLVFAFLASILYNLWPVTKTQALHSLPTLDFPNLPGSPSFKQDHLPSMWHLYNESNPETHFIKDGKIWENFTNSNYVSGPWWKKCH